ncbi:outer membrane lipoprotein carrier protein LolA [Microvirga sp. 2YAF29]|uniref:LolA family protein n=1 Tax=Microvirga sp. 2YAF29 TaxID=3233031 RepID=UPI003F989C88
MLKLSLRCILGLSVALACAAPAAAQQRNTDPVTRFLDGIFKSNQAQPTSEPAPQAAPEPQPAPAAPQPRTTAQPTPKPAAAPKPQTVQQPAPKPVAAPKPAAPATQQAKPAAPAPTAPTPARAVSEPAAAPAIEKSKAVEAPKPARATPAQAAPAVTSVAAPSAPPTPTSPPNPTSPAAALDRVNSYFNAIDQLSAYFVQKNPNGQQVEGTLSVRRPGQLHFAYAPPSTLEIVSDGRNVAIRDKKLGTNDVYPVGQTPLKFLLQENVDLARDTKVQDVQVGRDGMVTVRFDDSATLGGTSKITLRFDSRANALRQWIIVDSQGYETSVTLSGLNVVQKRNASAASN